MYSGHQEASSYMVRSVTQSPSNMHGKSRESYSVYWTYIVRRQVQREWTVMDTIRQRKLQLFGHICRMSDNRLLKSLVFGMEDDQDDLYRDGSKTF